MVEVGTNPIKAWNKLVFDLEQIPGIQEKISKMVTMNGQTKVEGTSEEIMGGEKERLIFFLRYKVGTLKIKKKLKTLGKLCLFLQITV